MFVIFSSFFTFENYYDFFSHLKYVFCVLYAYVISYYSFNEGPLAV